MSDGEFQIPDDERFWGGIRTQSVMEKKTGVEKIAQERLEQKVKHHHTLKGDYQMYPNFELVDLAEIALLGGTSGKGIGDLPFPKETIDKIIGKSYEERLIIAGALIAAEIDRLNFTE